MSIKRIFYCSGCHMPKTMVNAGWHAKEIACLDLDNSRESTKALHSHMHVHACVKTFPYTLNSPYISSLNSLSTQHVLSPWSAGSNDMFNAMLCGPSLYNSLEQKSMGNIGKHMDQIKVYLLVFLS